MSTGYTIESNMSKSIRFILFLLFVFAFLVSAPLLVLYTAGYRFDLTHGRIVHTAILNVTSTPRNATVLVDGERFSDRTPAVIETILPGEHLVQLEKTGYLPWETTLSFESREAFVIGSITLFLDAQPELQETLTAMLISPHPSSNNFAYISQESSWLEVWLMDASSKEKKLLMRLPFNTQSQYDLSWSKQGTYLLLEDKNGTQSDLYVSQVSDGTALDLGTASKHVEDYWWDLSLDETLYVRSNNILTRVNVLTSESTPFAFDADLIISHNNQEVILSQSNNRAVISYQEHGTASIITYLPLGDYLFIEAPEGLIALYDRHRNRFILIDLSRRDQPILLNEEVTIWKWSPDNNILMYSSGYDLKRYVRSAHETETITRLSHPINQLDWYPLGTTILYQTDGNLEALNLDNATTLSQTHLASGFFGIFWIDPDGKDFHMIESTETGWEWWTRALQN